MTPWVIAAAAVVVAVVATMLALPSWLREPAASSPLRFTMPWPTEASSGDTSLPPGTAGGSVSHRYPQFLPGGATFLYLDVTAEEGAGVYLGALDGSDPVLVLERQEIARYVPSVVGGTRGHLVFRRGATLMAQPFDAARGIPGAGAFPVAKGVGRAGNTGFAAFSIGPETLAYSEETLPLRDLAWVARSGDVIAMASEPAANATGATAICSCGRSMTDPRMR